MATSSKIIGKTDTSKRLSVPTKSLKSLPSFNGGHAVEFQAIDESGFVWTFKCSIRKKGQYRKPVLSKGWRASSATRSLKARSLSEKLKHRKMALFTSRLLKPGGVLATVSSRHHGSVFSSLMK
ncbi:B3 domain-containing transcription factor NGA4-like [Populus alba x Populus x berolinensis]|nr:B3 domain-containing transcription factor NGA4-like [Populus alba x Populus x berolinensis]